MILRTFLLAIGAAALLSTPPQANNVFNQVAASTDVAWLEKLASEVGAAEAITPRIYTPKTIRAAAYVRLGELASDVSLAAAKRVETAARAWSLVPATVSLAHMPHPSGHFGDSKPEPFVQVRAPDGVTYALIGLTRLGGSDVFLITSRSPADPSSWSRPLLVPDRAAHGVVEPALKWNGDGDRLSFEFRAPQSLGPGVTVSLRPHIVKPNPPPELQTWMLSLAAIRRDQDGDGWTDLEEQRLGTNAKMDDSDRDGIPDGRDAAPRYAPSALEPVDQEIAILQKVFFAGYGIYGSADLLSVAGGSRPFQPWGSRAPILYGLDRSEWIERFGYAGPLLSWKVIKLETDQAGVQTATVEYGDFEGAMAAAGYTATLKRYNGDWFVVKTVMNWIS